MKAIKYFSCLSILTFLLTSLTWAEPAPVEEFGRFRIGAQFTAVKSVLFGTEGGQKYVSPPDTYWASVGPIIYAEYLALDWLAAGVNYKALFEFGSVSLHDLDAFIKFVFPVSNAQHGSSYHIAIPAGYSVLSDRDKTFSTGRGFNVGALFGGNYFLNSFFGFTFDVNYTYRRISTERSATKAPIKFNFNDIGASVGMIVRF